MVDKKLLQSPLGVLLLIVSVFPLLIWLQNSGNPMLYLDSTVPQGQWAYVLSKLFGLYAMLAMASQILAGLLLRKGYSSVHRNLGLMVLTLLTLHGLLFVAAVSIRSGHIVWHLLAPAFLSGYYNMALAFGVMSFWASFVLCYAGLKVSRGYMSWKRAHWLSFPIFLASFSHGWMIGTESQSFWYQWFYAALALLVASALLLRLISVLVSQAANNLPEQRV